MVQMIQFLHMQGVPFHFLSYVLNSEIFAVVLIPLLIEYRMNKLSTFIHITFFAMGICIIFRQR